MVDIFSDPILPDSRSSSLPADNSHDKVKLHIEVALKKSAKCRPDATNQYIEQYIRDNFTCLSKGTELTNFDDYNSILKHNVECIYVVEVEGAQSEIVRIDCATFNIHTYQLHDSTLQLGGHEDDGGDLQGPFATVIDLPAQSLDRLWESLVFDTNIKDSLLQYISSLLLFTDRGVDPQLLAFQRLILLYGPPGSGKTSLCRSMAHKLAIRLSARYSHSKMIDVNATALFSRYFSESSKLVSALFEKIYHMIQDGETFVCITIDEVESLTTSRTTTMGSDPSDSMRVVNVLLTQLDRLKRKANVLVLTTTNMLEASDPAFIDRADLVQHVGMPGAASTYQILRSCLCELMRTKIIEPVEDLKSFEEANISRWKQRLSTSSRLVQISEDCSNHKMIRMPLTSIEPYTDEQHKKHKHRSLSGRTLRRLPLLAHSRHIRKTEPCTLDEMLRALSLTAESELQVQGEGS